MNFPPILSEDTQPRHPRLDDTRPNPITRRRDWWHQRGRLILAIIIFSTCVTLIVSLALLLRPNTAEILMSIPQKTITLRLNGDTRELQTGANTVSDVLKEQSIPLRAQDAISPEGHMPIYNGMIITIDSGRQITLTINGSVQTITTPFENPQDILENAGISLSESDRLWLDGTESSLANLALWTVPVMSIEIRKAVVLTLLDDGNESTLITTADSVGDALFDANIPLYVTDILSPPAQTSISGDMRVTIERAQAIKLIVDGVTLDTRTNASTVDDFLNEQGAALFGLDYVIPAGDSPITQGMAVEIVRVTEEVESTQEIIPYETAYQADASMKLDSRQIIQVGQNGIQETVTRIRYENGIEISRSSDVSTLVQSPVDEIVAYGTNIVINSIDTPEGPREYWRKLRVYATSYHPEALGGDNVTAIGMKLQKGVIGADPRLIPYRTQMFVPGYGIGVMADTGGARSSRYWIDLGYSDADYQAWHDYVDVYLLTPVPDELNYLLPIWTPIR